MTNGYLAKNLVQTRCWNLIIIPGRLFPIPIANMKKGLVQKTTALVRICNSFVLKALWRSVFKPKAAGMIAAVVSRKKKRRKNVLPDIVHAACLRNARKARNRSAFKQTPARNSAVDALKKTSRLKI